MSDKLRTAEEDLALLCYPNDKRKREQYLKQLRQFSEAVLEEGGRK